MTKYITTKPILLTFLTGKDSETYVIATNTVLEVKNNAIWCLGTESTDYASFHITNKSIVPFEDTVYEFV